MCEDCERWRGLGGRQRGNGVENVVKMSKEQSIIYLWKGQERGKTHSATTAPFHEIELASTIKTIAFADGRWSRYWSRMRGCPGISTARRGTLLFGRESTEEFVCSEACEGSGCPEVSCDLNV